MTHQSYGHPPEHQAAAGGDEGRHDDVPCRLALMQLRPLVGVHEGGSATSHGCSLHRQPTQVRCVCTEEQWHSNGTGAIALLDRGAIRARDAVMQPGLDDKVLRKRAERTEGVELCAVPASKWCRRQTAQRGAHQASHQGSMQV
jgi:hypothetical protein